MLGVHVCESIRFGAGGNHFRTFLFQKLLQFPLGVSEKLLVGERYRLSAFKCTFCGHMYHR